MAADVSLADWDTEFFGYPVARVELKNPTPGELENVEEKLSELNIRFASIFCSLKDEAANHWAADRGELLDVKTTYIIDVQSWPEDVEIQEVTKADFSPELLSLALQSGQYSRFRLDPHLLKDEFARMYEVWLKRSLAHEIAFTVMTIWRENRPVGLLTLGEKNDRADIGLLAVDQEMRGQGIGKQLLRAAHHRAQIKGFTTLQVVTQGRNTPACAFYESQGFQQEVVENVYHLWLN